MMEYDLLWRPGTGHMISYYPCSQWHPPVGAVPHVCTGRGFVGLFPHWLWTQNDRDLKHTTVP